MLGVQDVPWKGIVRCVTEEPVGVSKKDELYHGVVDTEMANTDVAADLITERQRTRMFCRQSGMCDASVEVMVSAWSMLTIVMEICNKRCNIAGQMTPRAMTTV